ncbi:MAG: tyrosine-protein phosphatase [Eubacterium sp.]|nr:tyrosine-protein phosphatase [Eubacterium sp.]
MKKVLSLILVFALALGLGVGVSFVQKDISAADINPTPEQGATVNLLKGDPLDFATHYSKGAINKYYVKGVDKYAPAPLVIEWEKVNGATSYKVKLSEDETMKDAKEFITFETKVTIEDLFSATDYYYQVSTEVDDTMYMSDVIKITTADIPRTISVDSVTNTRDFGGRLTVDKKYRVKQGIIYRGANVDEISSEGKRKMVETYGIKTDLDLRGKSKVSPLGKNINLVSVSAGQYINALDYDYWYPALRKEILTFANPNNFPIYVHCAIGRDRTGTLCTLIGALAGMSEQDIMRDYEFTFFSVVNGDVDDAAHYAEKMWKVINWLKTYDKGTLQENTMEFMRERLNLKQSDLNKIRSNILTPGAIPIPEPKVPTPSKVKLKKVKNIKKKTVKVTFKKASNAKGYQVTWSTSKNFTKQKSKTKSKYITKTTYKIKKLKKKKKYYIKVRAYNINGHIKVFGKYSKVKKIKIRK